MLGSLNIQVSLSIGNRDCWESARKFDYVFSDYLFGKTNNRPIINSRPILSPRSIWRKIAVAVTNMIFDLAVEDHGQFGGRRGQLGAADRRRRRGPGRTTRWPTRSASRSTTCRCRPSPTRRSVVQLRYGHDLLPRERRLQTRHQLARIPGTQSRLVVSVRRGRRRRYQSRHAHRLSPNGVRTLFVLFGAWCRSEKLIVDPIEVMTGVAKQLQAKAKLSRPVRGSRPLEPAEPAPQRDGGPPTGPGRRDWSPPTTGSP